jgi:transcriptional regulator with XRE-family HTH domain
VAHQLVTGPHPLQAVLDQQERTGAWLARRTEKSPAYVTKVLNGTRRPSADFKAKAAEALGVPEGILFPSKKAAA